MTALGRQIFVIVVCALCLKASEAKADWTMNLGYHNPVGSTVGANLLWFGERWAFEFGLGWIDLRHDTTKKDDDDDDDSGTTADEDQKEEDKRLSIGGDFDFKYRFRSGFFRPYLQAGLGWGHSRVMGESDVGQAGIGGPFAGAGLMFGKPAFYVYGSAVAGLSFDIGLQAGLGFDI